MNSRDEIQGLPPIVGDSPKILILGTGPRHASLSKRQYYAHVQNQFWKIMSEHVQCSHNSSYEARKLTLIENRVALWDVKKYCKLKGSLESKTEKELLNDIPAFLGKYPTIVRIGFNGEKAEKKFKKYFAMDMINRKQLQCILLPSTSSAYASMSLKEKQEQWAELFEGI